MQMRWGALMQSRAGEPWLHLGAKRVRYGERTAYHFVAH